MKATQSPRGETRKWVILPLRARRAPFRSETQRAESFPAREPLRDRSRRATNQPTLRRQRPRAATPPASGTRDSVVSVVRLKTDSQFARWMTRRAGSLRRSPRERDSRLSRRMVRRSLGSPRHSALYTTVLPSGAKRACSTSPRSYVSRRYVGASVGCVVPNVRPASIPSSDTCDQQRDGAHRASGSASGRA